MLSPGDAVRWTRASAYVGEHLGLDVQPERWPQLQTGFAAAARELGLGTTPAAIDALFAGAPTPERLQALAARLTNGETYFFREPATLDVLEQTILPALIAARRGRSQSLRLWCAACATGEEAYTLAILLHRLLLDAGDWRITLVATDVNAQFLDRAAEGRYREWSFRAFPPALRQRYFRSASNGCWTVVPEIRSMVRFRLLNLVDGRHTPLATGTDGMDLVCCRNALMYFTPGQARQAAGRLADSLAAGGWLALGQSEAPMQDFAGLQSVPFAGATLLRKAGAERQAASREAVAARAATRSRATREHAADSAAIGALARSLADRGRLAEALACCERWLAVDALDPRAHCLHAAVQFERGETAHARRALRKAVYLDGGLALSQGVLGSVACERGDRDGAVRRTRSTLRALAGDPSQLALAASVGAGAGPLAQALRALLAREAAR